jgi:hypothetical protein
MSGYRQPAVAFIKAVRAQCSGATPADSFSALQQRIARYPFTPGEHNQFNVLISSRHSGVPEFFLISSETEDIQPVNGDTAALGGGRALLAGMVENFARMVASEDYIRAQHHGMRGCGMPVTDADFPYWYAFLIHQLTFGEAGQDLLKLGVGGCVHFVAQDGTNEWLQRPSLYLLAQTHADDEGADLHIRRVAFDSDPELGDVLVGTDSGPGHQPEWHLIWDNSHLTWDTALVQQLNAEQQARLGAIVMHQQAAPLYHYFLAGGIDFKRRGQPRPPDDPYVAYVDVLRSWDIPATDLAFGTVTKPLWDFIRNHT